MNEKQQASKTEDLGVTAFRVLLAGHDERKRLDVKLSTLRGLDDAMESVLLRVQWYRCRKLPIPGWLANAREVLDALHKAVNRAE